MLNPIPTKDGSHTLFSKAAGQFYHNPNGAVEESKHVFFDHGGVYATLDENKPVHIFEMGLGTGLNLLLLDEALAARPNFTAPISFTSVEAFPISAETAASLNYGQFLTHPERMGALVDLFASLVPGWNEVPWPGRIQVRVWVGRVGVDGIDPHESAKGAHAMRPDVRTYTHFFHDPFSIEASPELWGGGGVGDVRLAPRDGRAGCAARDIRRGVEGARDDGSRGLVCGARARCARQA
jgi:tRNA U34 5-methylaminomethyl-2-thiouridine-forming methyltransferase MnmC